MELLSRSGKLAFPQNTLLQFLLHIAVALIADAAGKSNHGGGADPNQICQLLQPFKRNRIQMFQKVICDGPLDVGQMLIRISDLLLEICHRTLSFLM